MVLKKSVCKKCRIKELGKRGWNDMAESWFNPYYKNGKKTREGGIKCPYPIFNSLGKEIKRKALINATPAEKAMVEKGFVPIRNFQDSYAWPVKSNPPIWCPYKKEHIK